jgi:hypothetical protein
MKLHAARVPLIAGEMVKALTADQAIECEEPDEVRRDLEAVLLEYIRGEADLTERAKDRLAQLNRPQTEFGRIKRDIAQARGFQLGDDAIDYLLDQLIEILMHSTNVQEIFVEDVELRRRMRDPLRQEAAAEEQLQEEIRSRLRHVQEGTSLWEVEYLRMMDDIKRRRGL